MIEQLRKQKAEALDYYVKTKDKNVRSYMRKLDKLIKKGINTWVKQSTQKLN